MCTEVAHIAGLDKDFSDTSWRPSQLLQNMSYDEWKAFHKEKAKNSSPGFKRIKRKLSEKATYIKPEKWVLPNNKHIDSGKIIKKIGMPDKTNGSCTSVALAYVGNKAGYKVSDFKGGITREYFSNNDNIESIAKFDGVSSRIFKSEMT